MRLEDEPEPIAGPVQAEQLKASSPAETTVPDGKQDSQRVDPATQQPAVTTGKREVTLMEADAELAARQPAHAEPIKPSEREVDDRALPEATPEGTVAGEVLESHTERDNTRHEAPDGKDHNLDLTVQESASRVPDQAVKQQQQRPSGTTAPNNLKNN